MLVRRSYNGVRTVFQGSIYVHASPRLHTSYSTIPKKGQAAHKNDRYSPASASRPPILEKAAYLQSKISKEKPYDFTPPPVLPESLADYPTARQASETASEFLTRCPPLTSAVLGQNLMVYDPSCAPVPNSLLAERGGAAFRHRTSELMRTYRDMWDRLIKDNRGEALAEKLAPLQAKLTEDVMQVAKEQGVLAGRWLLYAEDEDLPRLWKTVVESVLEGRLGTGANLPTLSTSQNRRLRISTRDWSDKEDVRRVLDELVPLGLHRPESSDIVYKCDFYAYLNLHAPQKKFYLIPEFMYTSKKMMRKHEEVSGSQDLGDKDTVPIRREYVDAKSLLRKIPSIQHRKEDSQKKSNERKDSSAKRVS